MKNDDTSQRQFGLIDKPFHRLYKDEMCFYKRTIFRFERSLCACFKGAVDLAKFQTMIPGFPVADILPYMPNSSGRRFGFYGVFNDQHRCLLNKVNAYCMYAYG